MRPTTLDSGDRAQIGFGARDTVWPTNKKCLILGLPERTTRRQTTRWGPQIIDAITPPPRRSQIMAEVATQPATVTGTVVAQPAAGGLRRRYRLRRPRRYRRHLLRRSRSRRRSRPSTAPSGRREVHIDPVRARAMYIVSPRRVLPVIILVLLSVFTWRLALYIIPKPRSSGC